jgi:hypothetical protein
LDQPGQRYAHRVVEIGVGEAPVQLQAREDALKEDAARSRPARGRRRPRQTEAANR